MISLFKAYKKLSKDNSQLGVKIFEDNYLKHKQIYIEKEGSIYIINEEPKEQEKLRIQKEKDKSFVNKCFNDKYKEDKRQKEEQNLFNFIKDKDCLKDIASNKKINSFNNIYFKKKKSEIIEENYLIGIIIKIVAMALIYKILFFSKINTNNDIKTQLIFSYINKEILLLFIIIIFDILFI